MHVDENGASSNGDNENDNSTSNNMIGLYIAQGYRG
jgi:hypothetical protein